jgi:hypothetical protein
VISSEVTSPESEVVNQNRKTSAEKNSAVSILRNATRNPTATRLPVAFVVNVLIEGKAYSVTGLCPKDLK